ncbi:MAG: hypothetical protein ACK6A7_09610, partial [Planctomycetota bacterium]
MFTPLPTGRLAPNRFYSSDGLCRCVEIGQRFGLGSYDHAFDDARLFSTGSRLRPLDSDLNSHLTATLAERADSGR